MGGLADDDGALATGKDEVVGSLSVGGDILKPDSGFATGDISAGCARGSVFLGKSATFTGTSTLNNAK